MSLTIPVDFQEKVSHNDPAGYPYQIRASDLQKNFIYCALDADESLVENFTGPGGHIARRLKIPPPPSGATDSVTNVLSVQNGTLQWSAGSKQKILIT